MFLVAVSVHDSRNVCDRDEVGSAAEDAVGDRMHSMYRGAFGSVHVEVGLAVLCFILLFPFFLQSYAARSYHKPVKGKDDKTDEEDTSYYSSGNGTDIGTRVL